MEPGIRGGGLDAATILNGHALHLFHQGGGPGRIAFHADRMDGRPGRQHADGEDSGHQHANADQTPAFPLPGTIRVSSGLFRNGFLFLLLFRLAAQVPPEDQGKMPQQPHGNDVGRPFGHLFQRIVGGAENGYQPAGMQRVLPPAHLVQGPAGYPQRFVHPDDGVIMAAGFRKMVTWDS